jgi:hypothetical protein
MTNEKQRPKREKKKKKNAQMIKTKTQKEKKGKKKKSTLALGRRRVVSSSQFFKNIRMTRKSITCKTLEFLIVDPHINNHNELEYHITQNLVVVKLNILGCKFT